VRKQQQQQQLGKQPRTTMRKTTAMASKAAKDAKKIKPQKKAKKKQTQSSVAPRQQLAANRQKKGDLVPSPQNDDGCDDYVVDNDSEDGDDEVSNVKPPGQPTIAVVDMGHIIRPLAFRRHREWTVEEKNNLAAFMCNRAGIDASDKVAIGKAGLSDIFEFWFNEYVDLYETDKEFEKAIDPWQIVVIVKPANNVYIPILNLANQHIGGVGNANAVNEPVQFMYGQNWMLQITTGKENARRVVSFMKGHFVSQNIDFEALVQDYRTSLKDA
jgi:hypothetical protein